MVIDKGLIQKNPEILGGTPVFAGTRVPVQTLIDYLASGDCINDFLNDFPTVRREQVLGALDIMKNVLLTQTYESAS